MKFTIEPREAARLIAALAQAACKGSEGRDIEVEIEGGFVYVDAFGVCRASLKKGE